MSEQAAKKALQGAGRKLGRARIDKELRQRMLKSPISHADADELRSQLEASDITVDEFKTTIHEVATLLDKFRRVLEDTRADMNNKHADVNAQCADLVSRVASIESTLHPEDEEDEEADDEESRLSGVEQFFVIACASFLVLVLGYLLTAGW